MQRLPNGRFYCSRNQGTPRHCKSKVEIISTASQKLVLALCRRGVWPKDSEVCLVTLKLPGLVPDKPPGEPFVCTGLGGKGMGWLVLQVCSACYKRSLSILPLWIFSLFFVYTNTQARDLKDLWYSLAFVLIKSNLSGEGINLELLGCETKMKEALLIRVIKTLFLAIN